MRLIGCVMVCGMAFGLMGADGEGCGDTRVVEEDAGCVCPGVFAPVCGEDGETYSNACVAGCADVEVGYEGECIEPGCVCTLEYAPVCGEDGETYSNDCFAECAGVDVAYEGECDFECDENADCAGGEICYPPTHACQAECDVSCLIYDPVCGEDGNTYACGEESAWCRGVEVAHGGECPTTCGCDPEWEPVCGDDDVVYPNECAAICAGVEVGDDGACGG